MRSVADTDSCGCLGRLFPQKDEANGVWPKYRDTNIVYRVPYRAVCIAIRIAGCIIPALVGAMAVTVGIQTSGQDTETAMSAIV